jgi:hypothetical protein
VQLTEQSLRSINLLQLPFPGRKPDLLIAKLPDCRIYVVGVHRMYLSVAVPRSAAPSEAGSTRSGINREFVHQEQLLSAFSFYLDRTNFHRRSRQ